MVQILYIVAFTALSLLAISNLIRSMISLAQTDSGSRNNNVVKRKPTRFTHPELLDRDGNLTDEPLLVIRSMSMDDARMHLDALYEASPSTDA
ncbi:DUF2973 domain-containing protein [Tumidithrix elongata RA019]|uniref:DUF2973 domain-containing protein n=1 Tax=Tumidithrix elongata BACA0141 TaxID=2716417 RepID=A0AAW9Q4F8_9CYAN|nr:DUF2973 domain-containing protein [Tumidithrix elongata RA019]